MTFIQKVNRLRANGFLNFPFTITGVIDNWYTGHFPRNEFILFKGEKMKVIDK